MEHLRLFLKSRIDLFSYEILFIIHLQKYKTKIMAYLIFLINKAKESWKSSYFYESKLMQQAIKLIQHNLQSF